MSSVKYDFQEETVIVTGSSSGIGRSIALAFGRAGATVIVADVREQPKDLDAEVPTHEKIEAEGGTAEYVQTDVTDKAQLKSVVEAARAYGGVDVMMNNAGVYLNEPFLEVAPADFERVHRVNAMGVFLGSQVAAADMIDRDDPGAIVNTASISSDVAQYDQVAYDSSKGAVRMITKGSALELSDYGIRVNAVAPGAIATEFYQGCTEDTIEGVKNDDFIKTIPLGRPGYPDDIADAALFLASDAASYTTGELFPVDGGWQIY